MKQRITHGAMVDFLTPDEMVTLIPRPRLVTRVRAPETFQLDASGNGGGTVYKVPIGMEFAARRVTVSLSTTAGDPVTGAVTITAAGHWVQYLRSQTFIAWGSPSYAGVFQVPGVETWGDQQGPYLRNGETFDILVKGMTANAGLMVTVEGILTRPDANDDH